jgi:soluble lytic murein transglycosylase-like protein
MADYQTTATTYATQAGINPTIFVKQIQQESGFNPNAQSPAGALGIAQFMPGTAQSMNVNPWDPIAALKAAAYLDSANLQKYGGDYSKMLAAYNAGGGAVDRSVSLYGTNWLSHMPSETQNYVRAITNNVQVKKAQPATKDVNQNTTGNVITATLKQWGEYAAIFVIALVLFVIGFILLAEKQAKQVGKTIAKVAAL